MSVPNSLSLPVMLTRMVERVDRARDDSDAAYFYELLHLGEFALKLSTLAMVAAIDEDVKRHRYSALYQLVRADGVGNWAQAMGEVCKGPTTHFLASEASEYRRELTQTHLHGADTWQRRAVDTLLEACQVIVPDRAISNVKRSLLQWYDEFAWLRNQTRAHGATTDKKRSTAAPLIAESIDHVLNLGLFRVPWVYLRRNLSGKYRVIPIAGSSEPFDHLKQIQNQSLPDGVYIYLGSPRPVPLVETDVDLGDFYVANGNFTDQRYQMLSYLTDARTNGESSEYLLPPSELPLSETHSQSRLDIQGESFGNLPPPLTDYVPRPELEQSLRGLLLDDRHPVITLKGAGGVGKTSLALTVLHEFAEAGNFWAIIWFSARDIDLLQSGPTLVQPSILTLDDIARLITDCLQPAGCDLKGFDRLGFLRTCMGPDNGMGSVLFVFDNFETVRNPSEVYAALDNYIRLPNKILLTTRIRDFPADYPLSVEGMTRNQFDELATATIQRLGIDSLVSAPFLDDLYDESNGHPYVVKVLLGEVGAEGKDAKVKRIMATKDDLLDALFDRSFGTLPPAAQRAFLTLCNWRSVVPRLALEAALLRPSNERMDVGLAIDALERSSLVDTLRSSEHGDEFLRVPLAAWLFGERKLQVSSMRTVVEADTEVLRYFGAARGTDVAHGLGPRIDRMVGEVASRAQRGIDVSEDIQILEYVARGYPPTWLRIARLHEELGEADGLTRAIDAVRKYLEMHSDDRGAWKALDGLCERGLDYEGAANAAVRLAEQPGVPYSEISWAANRINGMLYLRTLVMVGDEKRLLVGKLRKLMEQRADEADPVDFSQLAWLCLHLNDEKAARGYVARGLELDASSDHLIRLADKLDVDRSD